MTNDLPTGPAPEPVPHSGGPDELAALTAPRRLTVDDPMFTPPERLGTFRLQLFTAPGARPVAVAIQIAGEEGMGLANAAERYAGAVWERHCSDQDLPPVWVECQILPEEPLQEARFQRVVFAGTEGYLPRRPRWSLITLEQLQDLVGAPVATDRGTGYVPRPVLPQPLLEFDEFPVVRLGRPRPFREPGCMPAGISWWRRWARQILPRRGARTCCWYHGGDWHTVNTMALQVLKQARARSVDPQDMTNLAVDHATATGATDWQTQALTSLFSIANAIQPGSQSSYINGQHRAQAMLDAGVRRTVALHYVHRT
ncbi:hypothetical protein ACFWV1_18520 [Streptomyces sp. NPDC058700]|uniref:hypothetical protein n=1 Tax=Streptomyces sp. NPDC058700 TaxID=3346607 RepID=UPI00365F049B